MTGRRYAEVVLPLPLGTPYSYSIPPSLADKVGPGSRVVVPLRSRELIGIVGAVAEAAPEVAVKDILGVPDDTPALSANLLQTARWMAGYYGAPLGLAVKAMLPGAMWGASTVQVSVTGRAGNIGGLAGQVVEWLRARGGSANTGSIGRHLKRSPWEVIGRLHRVGAVSLEVLPAKSAAARLTRKVVRLTEMGRLDGAIAKLPGAPRQQELVRVLRRRGGEAPVSEVRNSLGFSDSVWHALAAKELVTVVDEEVSRDPFADYPATPPPRQITPAQQEVLATVKQLPAGGGAVLMGVTGSGKTLVYLEAIRHLVAEGRGAIILVPEIGLTPQTVSRVRGVFGDQVAVLHSGLSDGERADAWRSLRSGECLVAVGARSAVFAPVQRLGMIVIDEEHEASYKNGEVPRYHAREVAGVRARLEGATVLLGSATPSLETMVRVGADLVKVALPERAAGRPLPPVRLVDLKSTAQTVDSGPLPWSDALDSAVAGALERNEQALLLLNRRGFAAYLQCPGCGAVVSCPNCSISLTVHRKPPHLRCHYCDHQTRIPGSCSECGEEVQQMRGVGTQQLERFVAARFPGARLARMDLDTTATKWAHQQILGAVERREVDVLLGTQMIAKGLDFPGVTVVGIVDADTALYLPDFRSAERTFQLVAQTAGRAGRGPDGGVVVVQTRNPDHYALSFASRHDTEGFISRELEMRRNPPYPPHVKLANLVVSGEDEYRVSKAASAVADWCRRVIENNDLSLETLGPAPAPLSRIKDRWRWHVVLRGDGTELGRVVRYGVDKFPHGRVRVVIDRDPVSLL